MIEIESPDHELIQVSEPLLNADPCMTYDEFFRECLVKNRPCVFRAGLTDEWKSVNDWVLNEEPNFEYLRAHYGACKGPVVNCQQNYYKQPRKSMCINDYIDYWIDFKQHNTDEVLYLKDWHCVKQSESSSFYEVPQYFASDWLNEYCIEKQLDDYMFVYMGPKGSWTPFHVDVLTSYSWSANICGKKKWLFYPPGQETLFLNNRETSQDVTNEDIYDSRQFKNSNSESKGSFEIIQEPGQVVFVPSGWYHQVWNLEDTISINHNWINGCNVFHVWSRLKSDLLSVIKEINDCYGMDNWSKHCQLILKASFGLDYMEFLDIIEFIAERRIQAVLCNTFTTNFGKWHQGLRHCQFDLKQIQIVLEDFAKEVEDKSLEDICCLPKILDLSQLIAKALV